MAAIAARVARRALKKLSHLAPWFPLQQRVLNAKSNRSNGDTKFIQTRGLVIALCAAGCRSGRPSNGGGPDASPGLDDHGATTSDPSDPEAPRAPTRAAA